MPIDSEAQTVTCPACAHEFAYGGEAKEDPIDTEEDGSGETVTESFTDALRRQRKTR